MLRDKPLLGYQDSLDQEVYAANTDADKPTGERADSGQHTLEVFHTPMLFWSIINPTEVFINDLAIKSLSNTKIAFRPILHLQIGKSTLLRMGNSEYFLMSIGIEYPARNCSQQAAE